MVYKITEEGKNKLINERDHLSKEIEEIKIRLETARAFGDLKENAEYNESKTALVKAQMQMNELSKILGNCNIISKDTITGNVVGFGSTVLVKNFNNNQESTYKIVGDFEADAEKGLLSEESPLGKSILGKKLNEEFEFVNIRGVTKYKIIKISVK